MEDRFCRRVKELGCTCVTISHRPALMAFHDLVLALDGEGGWALHDGARNGAAAAVHSGEAAGGGAAAAPPGVRMRRILLWALSSLQPALPNLRWMQHVCWGRGPQYSVYGSPYSGWCIVKRTGTADCLQ